MNRKIKSKQNSLTKSSGKTIVPKKNNKSHEREATPKSTKQSTPTSNTPSIKQRTKIKYVTKATPDKVKQIRLDQGGSSNESSIDTSGIMKETDIIKAKVLGSLQCFKIASTEYISQNLALQNEVDTFQENFLSVKNEVSEILWESSKSKEELSKMRIIIESPKSRVIESGSLNLDLSSVMSQKEEILYETLNHLQEEINEMRQIIENNEKQVREKEAENNELKSIAFRLRDSLITETLSLETEENKPSCTSCSIF